MEYWPQWVLSFLLVLKCLGCIVEGLTKPDTASKWGFVVGGFAYWGIFATILWFGGFFN